MTLEIRGAELKDVSSSFAFKMEFIVFRHVSAKQEMLFLFFVTYNIQHILRNYFYVVTANIPLEIEATHFKLG